MDLIEEAGDSETVAVPARRATPPALIIEVGGRAYTVYPGDGPITVGREFPAQVQIEDPRVSRNHLRIEARGAQWTAVDNSSNGSFVDGVQQRDIALTDGMTVHLGHPEGIAVSFAFASSAAAPRSALHTPVTADVVDSEAEDTPDGEETDPGIARAGAAVAQRRRELNLAQRTLAREKIMNAGALIAFEKGRSWPHKSTQTKLERVLGWEPGTISRIREQGLTPTPAPVPVSASTVSAPPAPTGETTGIVLTTVEAPLMADAVKLALETITSGIDALPAPDDDTYSDRVGAALRDLRRLETLAANAARGARGATEVALVLSGVRRTYRDLMLRAARSPRATLGQRLYAARHHAELTVEEAANAAGVSAADVMAIEAGGNVDAVAVSAVEALLSTLGGH